MAKTQFGKTWWGEQWLNSLANIDYSNRLPRGATYARNGSIQRIKIEENNIEAKVQGSRPKPYHVTIVIPPFFEPEIKKLIAAISQKPTIISKLLNRELDPELLTIAEQCGLKIFPKQWTDFKMQCSCPDGAVPCKHLAAVVYKVSIAIDNNPFLVFQLHRVDLPQELEKVNIHITEQNHTILSLKELLQQAQSKSVSNKIDSGITPKKNSKKLASEHVLFNYATLSPILDAVIQLLPDAPVFYPQKGNFRDKYASSLRKVNKVAQRIIQGKAPLNLHQDIRNRGSVFLFNHHDTCSLVIDANNLLRIELNYVEKKISLQELLSALWQIPAAYEKEYQPEIATLKNVLLLALNLLATGSIVPQIVKLDNGQHLIRWLPAMLSNEVRLLVDQLQQTLPSTILLFDDSKSHRSTTDIPRIVPQGAIHLTSIFLNELIQHFFDKKSDDSFLNFFFYNNYGPFNKPGEGSIAGGVQSWLQRYYLRQGKYKPMLIVEELRGERFKVDIDIVEISKPQEKPISIANIFAGQTYEKNRFEILQSLTQLGSFIPGLDAYVNDQGKSGLVMDIHSFTPFLMQAIPAIQLLDIDILLPKSLRRILKPKASVKIKQKRDTSSGLLGLDSLLDFDWQVAIGDATVGEEEFNTLMKNANGLIKYKTQYIYVNSSELEKLHKHFQSSKELSAYEMLRIALSHDYHGAQVRLTDEVEQLITELTSQKEIPLPENIQAQLRPYQIRGYSWMYRNTQIGFGSVLADDMGLGKTLQVITVLQKYKEEGLLNKQKAMVVAPTGLLTNWQAEIEKFAPTMQCKLYHGTNRTIEKDENYDVLLTTYGIVRSDADKLKKLAWYVMITDEAQNIKNHTAEQSKAVKSIKAKTYIAMSGTPVENRLSELWSIMDFSNRGFLGPLSDFKESFSDPIQNTNDIEAANKLKKITAPFLMRRLKSDKTIINDLPDKIEMNSYCQLAPNQASLYEKTLQEALKAIEEAGDDKKSLFARQGLVLQMILALKQICNHPTQFLKNKVLDASLSGKTQLLFDKLESIVESNEKVLIFTQFTEMGEMLKHFITEKFGEEPLFYHGGCTLKKRKEMVDGFQNNRADKIFILSLKAAGTGLNLTAANHVIHYDLWWNPAVEAQATDRAYRIGQKSNVMVHRFITKGSFEERINELIQSKKNLADMTVSTGENWIGSLSNKEIRDIFTLG